MCQHCLSLAFNALKTEQEKSQERARAEDLKSEVTLFRIPYLQLVFTSLFQFY